MVSHGGEQYKLAIEVTAAPGLNAFVESGQNVGTLVVVTGQDKSRVFLDGKALPQETQGRPVADRQSQAQGIRGASRQARLSGDSRPENTHSQRRAGKACVRLASRSRIMASLNIQGGPAGATVLIDQTSAGTVQPDGTLHLWRLPLATTRLSCAKIASSQSRSRSTLSWEPGGPFGMLTRHWTPRRAN